MKTITNQEFRLINELDIEGLTTLEPGIIEKDLLVTEALQVAVGLINPDIRPVFCGGTCWPKAVTFAPDDRSMVGQFRWPLTVWPYPVALALADHI